MHEKEVPVRFIRSIVWIVQAFFIANLEGRRKHHDCYYWNNQRDKWNKLARLYGHSVSFHMRKFRQYWGGTAFSFLWYRIIGPFRAFFGTRHLVEYGPVGYHGKSHLFCGKTPIRWQVAFLLLKNMESWWTWWTHAVETREKLVRS